MEIEGKKNPLLGFANPREPNREVQKARREEFAKHLCVSLPEMIFDKTKKL